MDTKLKSLNLGFTILELLVVLAIIGLVSAVGISSMSEARSKARNANRLQEVNSYTKAAEIYFATNRRYPGSAVTYRCLAKQTGEQCTFGTGTPIAGDTTLYTHFQGVLNGMPPASQDLGLGGYTGYHYACVGSGTGACSGYLIRYMLEGANQQCASGSLVIDPAFTHASISPSRLTYCQVVKCPLGLSPARSGGATSAYVCQ